eukprot:SAG31_NODE_33608_length_342_cov_0.580247_1_plen_58_part_01
MFRNVNVLYPHITVLYGRSTKFRDDATRACRAPMISVLRACSSDLGVVTMSESGLLVI